MTFTENYMKIEFAILQGAIVHNGKGERIRLVGKNDRPEYRYPDAIKCYVDGVSYYLSSAEKQEGLTFDGLPYDEWKEKPIEVS